MAIDPADVPARIKDAHKAFMKGEMNEMQWWSMCDGKNTAKEYEKALGLKSASQSPRGTVERTRSSRLVRGPPPPSRRYDDDWNDDSEEEEEETDSPYEAPTPTAAPPVFAVALAALLTLMYEGTGTLELVGVVLVSISFAFNLMGLIWLEILTLPFFRNRSEVLWDWKLWGIIMGVSIAASLTIIATNYIPGQKPYEEIFNSPGLHQFQLLEIALMIQVLFNFLLTWSMGWTNSGERRLDASKKILRSPWTVGSIASLATCWFLVQYPNHVWGGDLIIMLLGASIVGSSAWVYGRHEVSTNKTLMLHASTPYLIILIVYQWLDDQMGLTNSSQLFFAFLAFPLALNFLTWMLPKRTSDYTKQDFEGTSIGVNWPNMVILIGAIGTIAAISYQSDTKIIPLIPLFFVYHIYSREHSRKMGGDILKVHRILPRDSSNIGAFKKVGLKFSLLGPTESGKTSFATALWTLMREPDNMHIWWSNQVEPRGKHKILGLGKNTDRKTLEALAARGKSTVEDMMDARISGTTCREFWDGNNNGIQPGSLPRPEAGVPFPFFAEAFQESQKILNNFMRLVVEPDPKKRDFPPATSSGKKIEIVISFLADVEVKSPSFLFTTPPMSRSSTRDLETEVELILETWDIRGENFSAAVNHTREQLHKYGPHNRMKLKQDITKAWIMENHPDANASQTQQARTLFLDSSHSFLLVDVEDLIIGDTKGIKEYLRLMQIMNRDGNSNLESLTILLNKADNLLDAATDTELVNWADMNDDEKASELLNRSTNYALDQLKSTGMLVDAKFVCAFGGLAPLMEGTKKDSKQVMEDGKKKVIPPYPLIPVNVIEPLIEVILTSRLHSEDI